MRLSVIVLGCVAFAYATSPVIPAGFLLDGSPPRFVSIFNNTNVVSLPNALPTTLVVYKIGGNKEFVYYLSSTCDLMEYSGTSTGGSAMRQYTLPSSTCSGPWLALGRLWVRVDTSLHMVACNLTTSSNMNVDITPTGGYADLLLGVDNQNNPVSFNGIDRFDTPARTASVFEVDKSSLADVTTVTPSTISGKKYIQNRAIWCGNYVQTVPYSINITAAPTQQIMDKIGNLILFHKLSNGFNISVYSLITLPAVGPSPTTFNNNLPNTLVVQCDRTPAGESLCSFGCGSTTAGQFGICMFNTGNMRLTYLDCNTTVGAPVVVLTTNDEVFYTMSGNLMKVQRGGGGAIKTIATAVTVVPVFQPLNVNTNQMCKGKSDCNAFYAAAQNVYDAPKETAASDPNYSAKLVQDSKKWFIYNNGSATLALGLQDPFPTILISSSAVTSQYIQIVDEAFYFVAPKDGKCTLQVSSAGAAGTVKLTFDIIYCTDSGSSSQKLVWNQGRLQLQHFQTKTVAIFDCELGSVGKFDNMTMITAIGFGDMTLMMNITANPDPLWIGMEYVEPATSTAQNKFMKLTSVGNRLAEVLLNAPGYANIPLLQFSKMIEAEALCDQTLWSDPYDIGVPKFHTTQSYFVDFKGNLVLIGGTPTFYTHSGDIATAAVKMSSTTSFDINTPAFCDTVGCYVQCDGGYICYYNASGLMRTSSAARTGQKLINYSGNKWVLHSVSGITVTDLVNVTNDIVANANGGVVMTSVLAVLTGASCAADGPVCEIGITKAMFEPEEEPTKIADSSTAIILCSIISAVLIVLIIAAFFVPAKKVV